jgi:hypothetical protein
MGGSDVARLGCAALFLRGGPSQAVSSSYGDSSAYGKERLRGSARAQSCRDGLRLSHNLLHGLCSLFLASGMGRCGEREGERAANLPRRRRRALSERSRRRTFLRPVGHFPWFARKQQLCVAVGRKELIFAKPKGRLTWTPGAEVALRLLSARLCQNMAKMLERGDEEVSPVPPVPC